MFVFVGGGESVTTASPPYTRSGVYNRLGTFRSVLGLPLLCRNITIDSSAPLHYHD